MSTENEIKEEDIYEAPLTKADPVKRIIAFIIDAAASMVLGFIPFVGGIIGALYMLLRDALPIEALEHKSIGKKLVGFGFKLSWNESNNCKIWER